MIAQSTKQEGLRRSARKEFIEQNRLRVSYEKKLRLRMITVFAEIGQQARRSYTGSGRLVGTERFAADKIRTTLNAHYTAIIEEFGLRVLRNRKQETQFERLIQSYINSTGATRVVGITNTTVQQLARIISAGEADGLGVERIGRNIFESMRGSFSRYRAATIARTETHNAASYANHAVNESLGIPNQKKRWVATADARTRQTHAAANGTEVDINEDFIIGGVPMSYTGDPRGGPANVINCRCVTLYIDPEDEFETTQAETDFNNPWGDVSEDERRWHNAAGWNRTSKQSYTVNIIKAIGATKALGRVINTKKRAYCTNDGANINMGTDPKFDKLTPDQMTVWRHEYGHSIDFRAQSARIYPAVGPAAPSGRTYQPSAAAAFAIKSDRNKRIKWSEEQKRKKRMQDNEGYKEFEVSDEFDDFEKELWKQFQFQPSALPVSTLRKLVKWSGSPLDYDDLVAIGGEDFWKKGGFATFIHASRLGYMNKWSGSMGFYYRISKNEEGLMFNDFIEAVGNGNAGFGHGYTYMNRGPKYTTGVKRGHVVEAFANYVSLLGGENADIWRKLMMHHAPETTEALDEITELIATAPRPN